MISEALNMDNMLYMKQFPDKFFDLAIVDPPYGIDIQKMNFTQSLSGGVAKRKDYSKITDWDNKTPDRKYFDELFRVSKNQIIFGANYFIEFLGACKGFVIWDKRTDSKYSNDFSDCEFAWSSFNKPARCFRFLWSGMMQGNMKNKEERFHPTQKPYVLYRWIIENYTSPNDKILDTHLGSGSSRIAAYDLGFDFYSCELDKDYFDAQEKRFAKHIAQQQLFAPERQLVTQTTLL